MLVGAQRSICTREGARLLYASITRARAAVFLACAHGRNQKGVFVHHSLSRYAAFRLQMQYQHQPTGVRPPLPQTIAATCAFLGDSGRRSSVASTDPPARL